MSGEKPTAECIAFYSEKFCIEQVRDFHYNFWNKENAMYEKFTDRTRRILKYAHQLAGKLNYEYVNPEHLLLGLLQDPDSVASTAISRLGVNLSTVKSELEDQMPASPFPHHLPQLSSLSRKVVEGAIQFAREFGDNRVGTEHLLLSLCELKLDDGLAHTVLAYFDIINRAPDEVRWLLGKNDTDERYRNVLQQIVRVISDYVEDCDAKKAVEAISAICKTE